MEWSGRLERNFEVDQKLLSDDDRMSFAVQWFNHRRSRLSALPIEGFSSSAATNRQCCINYIANVIQ